MGCICSILKSLTSYHGTHLTPEQIERQRLFRLQKGAATPVKKPNASAPSPSPSPSPNRPSEVDSPVHGRKYSYQHNIHSPPQASSQSSFTSLIGGKQKSTESNPNVNPTFVHRSPQIKHQKSFNQSESHYYQHPSQHHQQQKQHKFQSSKSQSTASSKRVTFSIRSFSKDMGTNRSSN